ncbi:MAG: hypothetical protein VYC71_00075 [Planctomycetota bacterium]|nr:hypothetical protein [Planctomycetota bacterium]
MDISAGDRGTGEMEFDDGGTMMHFFLGAEGLSFNQNTDPSKSRLAVTHEMGWAIP